MWRNKQGYYTCSVKTNNGYKTRLYHRVVVERIIGRELKRHEEVHHIDEDKNNNDPENLKILITKVHRRLHAEEEYKKKLNGLDPSKYRLCTKCKYIKNVDNFYKTRGTRTPQCKPCIRKVVNNYTKSHRIQILERVNRYRENIRQDPVKNEQYLKNKRAKAREKHRSSIVS